MQQQGKQFGIVRTLGITLRPSYPQPVARTQRFRQELVLVPVMVSDTTRDAEPNPGTIWRQSIRPLAEQCATEHPTISVDSNVLGGIPHIAGTRLSVGQVLGRLYVLESVNGLVQYYRGRVTADQIKEALAYAQDFIETVCEPPEDNG